MSQYDRCHPLVSSGGLSLTFSRYLSTMSWPQLAHTFLPADGTELPVEAGEHADGVHGLLVLLVLVGDKRVSSRSMLVRCDSPSECGCSGEARLRSDTRTQHITARAARSRHFTRRKMGVN